MLIEFTGLPGSGKTTIADKLIDRIGGEVDVKIGTFDHLGTVRRVTSKLAFAFTSFFIFPKDSFLVVKELSINHNSKMEAVRDALNILYLMTRYHKAKKQKETDSIYIFDQGLIQAFLSSCMYGQWSDSIFETLKKYSGRVIFVDVSPEISSARLSERGDKSSRVQKKGGQIERLAEQERCLMKIITNLEFSKNKVITLPNNNEIKPEQIKQIVDLLLK